MGDGWWVLVVAGIVCLGLMTWALAPALLQMGERPPGDGQQVETFAFDLSQPSIDPDLLHAAMLHRDMFPILNDPTILTMSEVDALNANRRTRYLVSDDLVIGVVVDGTARAYPISVLNVHEIVNDRIGDVPILASWHWPSGVSRVFDRRTDGDEVLYGSSGLVAGGSMLLYAKEPGSPPGDEALFSQLLASQVTGAGAGTSLRTIPHQHIRWADWKAMHPTTTVIASDPGLKKRYSKSSPNTWYLGDDLMFDMEPPPIGPRAKAWVTVVDVDGVRRVQPWPWLHEHAPSGSLEVPLGDRVIRYVITRNPDTVTVLDAETGEPLESVNALWYAWHALNGPEGLSTGDVEIQP